MIEYFNTHLHAFWFTAGFLLLAIELLVLGFSTGFVLFLGLGALLTGGLLWAGILSDTWLASIGSFALSSALISAALWKPLKSMEKTRNNDVHDTSSDFVGLVFNLESDLSSNSTSKTRYSGIEWKVELDEGSLNKQLGAGTRVTVVSVDAGKFRVAPLDES
ncbi:MAG: NfeD family protein [Gammaproteobacteria bacterium]|nr:NfeD family protein [Gammaproteobacteria bacterium]